MSSHGLLILVQGLAGSGKSHLIQLLKHDFLIEENFAISDDAEAQNIQNLAQNLQCGRRCIVSERKYRSHKARSDFIAKVEAELHPAPLPTISIICFENNLESANHNCSVRANKPHDPSGDGHICQNESDSKDYEIPDDAIVVKIYRIPSAASVG